MECVVVIHCNDRFGEDIHAEIVGAGGSDVGRCNRAVGYMIHVELHGHGVGYFDVESTRIRTVLDGRFDDLEGSCHRPNRFGGLHRHLDITNERRGFVLVLRLDHDVRERARLGMAERIYDIVCSGDIDVGNCSGQLKASNAWQ